MLQVSGNRFMHSVLTNDKSQILQLAKFTGAPLVLDGRESLDNELLSVQHSIFIDDDLQASSEIKSASGRADLPSSWTRR